MKDIVERYEHESYDKTGVGKGDQKIMQMHLGKFDDASSEFGLERIHRNVELDQLARLRLRHPAIIHLWIQNGVTLAGNPLGWKGKISACRKHGKRKQLSGRKSLAVT